MRRFLFLILAIAALGRSQTTPSEFKDPPAAYRPSPFWSWNSALDDDELRWQIQQFKDKGYGGYFMHSRVGLVTRYLSDEWFHKIAVCLAEGRRLGLASWLYDEDKWPSGFAGGMATHDHPEFVAMGMGLRDIPAADLRQSLVNPQTLGIFDVTDTTFHRVTKTSDKVQGRLVQFFAQPYQKTNWFNGEAYLDTLNPDAVAYFLKLTFTNGYNRLQKDYGPAMPGVFTDEPNFQAGRGRDRTVFPWTPWLPEIFRAKFGYDLIDQLPLLVQTLPGFEQVRYDFWRAVAEQFESAYSAQYGDMMGKIGLKLTGHYLDEDTLGSQTRVTGSVMLNYLHQQMPGIDHLQRNIDNPLTKKQASSVAHQFGRERVLSEIWGVSGHTASFEDLKWVADFHFVLGINFLTPHLSLYSMAGDRKRDYPPTFSYHQPYWPAMRLLNDYLGRAAYFVTRGKPQTDILLLEPLGSAWAHFAPGPRPEAVTSLERRFLDTFDTLLALHRDFDLGEEIILERSAQVEKGVLRVGPEGRYKVVVVPPAYRWNHNTAELLDHFMLAGGKVIFRGAQPGVLQSVISEGNSFDISENAEDLAAALDKALPRDISILGEDGNEIGDILYQHRSEGKRQYYFLTNTSRQHSYHATIKLPVPARAAIEEWDLTTGEVRPGSLAHVFPPAGSFALAVDLAPARKFKPPASSDLNGQIEVFSGPFAFQRLQPNTLVLDVCRYTLNDQAEQGPVPVWRVRQAAFKEAGLEAYVGLQPWALEWKNIKPDKTARVRMRFEFDSELERPSAWLVIEKPANYEVKINGEAAPAPDGWYWDKQFGKINISSLVHRGTNRVELATVYKPGVEIEDIFVIGDFATKKLSDTKYALAEEPKQLNPGNWTGQGYYFYSGNMSYQVPVDFKAGEHVALQLKQPVGTAFTVRAGGREVARIGWQPWTADVTSALKPGRNMLEVVVYSSLQNTFGPLHNDTYQTKGQNWWFGPNAFTDEKHWTDSYYHFPYGLGGVELIRH